VPGPLAAWAPERVRLNGAEAKLIALDDGFLHVRVLPGVQLLEVEGALPPSDTLTLRLGDRPARVRVSSEGYELSGVRADGTADDSIELRRLLPEASDQASVGLPPWFSVTRSFEIGPELRVHTTIERLTPRGGASLVHLPLMAAESVHDARVQVREGKALVAFGPDDTSFELESSLAARPELELVASVDAPYSERWIVRCGSMWQCQSEGLVPVRHEAEGEWQPLYRPWPGEKLKIRLSKPAPAPGQSTTIDAVQLTVRPGVRATDAALTVSLRSSRGGVHKIGFPQGAQLRSFSVNGERRPIQRDGAAHSFSVLPGRANVVAELELPTGIENVMTVPEITLDTPARNARVIVQRPADRWLLWTRGPAWGPAILFWGYLLMVVLVALALGRARHARAGRNLPLGTWQWLLLGLGLTQVDSFEVLAVVLFFFVLAWRARTTELSWFKHDVLQLALLVWALIFAGALFNAVQQGLLVQPDMQVQGAGSDDTNLQWYVDSTGTKLPTPTLISVPLWVYRVLMLLWSLWLARQLMHWAPWAFRAYSAGGLWKRRPKPARPVVPAPPPAAPPAPPGG